MATTTHKKDKHKICSRKNDRLKKVFIFVCPKDLLTQISHFIYYGHADIQIDSRQTERQAGRQKDRQNQNIIFDVMNIIICRKIVFV